MPPARATVIAFLNFKGGVGKTANVVNIGACLAATHRKRVLIVDLDAQCNASLWLLGKPRFREHTRDPARTVLQLVKDRIDGTRRFRLEDAVLRGVPLSEEGHPLIGTLHLLPSVVELMRVEDQLGRRLDGYRYLFDQMTPVRTEYDYVLLDCPPNFFTLTKNAVFFADRLAVPYIPDFLSLAGFRTLAHLVEEFGARISGNRTALGRTRISALIVNRYQSIGNVFQQGLLELERLTQDLKHEGLIHPEAAVLQPPVRSCVKVAESSAEHLPVLLHAPDSIGATDYGALTESFIRHYRGRP
jgi:chromosome partitioning protein